MFSLGSDNNLDDFSRSFTFIHLYLIPPSRSALLPQIARMGFTDLVSDAGLTVLNSYLSTRSYIVG